MGFGKRSNKSSEEPLSSAIVAPMARPLSPGSGDATYIDETSELSGSLKLHKSVHIAGTVEGEIECEATVTVASTGKVSARVSAACVVIEGEVHGDIDASDEITLSKTARVYGDMNTEGIVIEKGAKVEGRITIGSSKPTGAKARPSAPSASGASGGPDVTKVLERAALDDATKR